MRVTRIVREFLYFTNDVVAMFTMKVYQVKNDSADEMFEYAVSVASSANGSNGVVFHYSFQPELVVRTKKSRSFETILLCVSSFGVCYTLLNMVSGFLFKGKDLGKRDSYVSYKQLISYETLPCQSAHRVFCQTLEVHRHYN